MFLGQCKKVIYFQEKEIFMATLTKRIPAEPANLPTVRYSDEANERWDKEAEIARALIATGELYPQTAEQFAAEMGIRFG
jgi:hypothetical protein